MNSISSCLSRDSETYFIAKLSLSNVTKICYPIMRIFLLEFNREEFLFGYIETGEDITLIMDETCAKYFENIPEVVFEGRRRKAFQFSFTCSPSDDSGVISCVTSPFTKNSIDIFYFTTVNSDFVFVEESNFQRSTNILKQEFANIWVDEDSPMSSKHSPEPPEPQDEVSHPKTSVNWKSLHSFPKVQVILSIMNTNHEGFQTNLFRLLFFPTTTNRFVSVAFIENEISLLWDVDTFQSFDRRFLQTTLNEIWIPIKRVLKDGFHEVGIVSGLVEPLRKQSLLYLSTFNTSYIFVSAKQYEQGIKMLEESNFRVFEQVNKT